MRLIDRYLLWETLKPLSLSLAVVLTALLVERVSRLMDRVVVDGGPISLVIRMIINLVPHYLGLALPAAFFISILIVMARLGDDNEVDVLQSSGLSLLRLSAPFFGLALIFTIISLLLFGYLQPYSRYAYRAVLHAAEHALWDAAVPQSVFISETGATLTAETVDKAGRRMTGVFIFEDKGDVRIVTTAAEGILEPGPEAGRLRLTLRNAVQLRERDHAVNPSILRFDEVRLGRDFSADHPAFRSRGSDERELTLDELWRERTLPSVNAELHARLARGVSTLLLPMLAIPLGLAAKRARCTQGMVIAALILVLYHHAVQFGESMSGLGWVPASLGIWLPFALFAAASLWIFRTVDTGPRRNPLLYLLDAFDTGLRALTTPLRRGWRRGSL